MAAAATMSRRMGLIVAGCLISGLVAAIVLVAFPAAGAEEHVITGTVLLGFAFGWALLAVISMRFTDQPQGWAAVPAALMASAGAGLIIFAPGDKALGASGWVWSPVLLALVVWMTVQAARLRAWGKSLGGRVSVDSRFDLASEEGGTLMRWSAEVDAAGLFSGLGSQSLGAVAKLHADRALGRLARNLERTPRRTPTT